MARASIAMATLMLLAPAMSQRGVPHIGYVVPAGGSAGTTFRVEVGGQGLRGVRFARFSGTGIEATVVRWLPPPRRLDREQARVLRRRLAALRGRQLRDAPGNDAAPVAVEDGLPDHPMLEGLEDMSVLELQRVADYFLRRADPRQRKRSIEEIVELEITIAPGVDPGRRDMRLGTRSGTSTPLCFVVGQLAEFRETEPSYPDLTGTEKVELPVTLNGQIVPRDVDRFGFRAEGGQTLVFEAQARALVPFQADSVPGWMQATLAILDAKGHELAFADDHHFDPDPILRWTVPETGSYVLEVRDALQRGRADFVYRIEASVAPADSDGPARAQPTAGDEGAARLELPAIVAGCIGLPGEEDVHEFQGRVGEDIVVEVDARKLGSPLDSVIWLVDPEDRVVAWNDDWAPEIPGIRAVGRQTHHADSFLRATLEESGTYRLRLADVTRAGSPEHVYRLRICHPQPGVELYATPSTINVPAGGAATISVAVIRRDGWSGPVEIALADPVTGLTLGPTTIPAGQARMDLELSAAPKAARKPMLLRLVGRIDAAGKSEEFAVTPADDVMQAFLWRHLLPAEELVVHVARPRRTPSR